MLVTLLLATVPTGQLGVHALAKLNAPATHVGHWLIAGPVQVAQEAKGQETQVRAAER